MTTDELIDSLAGDLASTGKASAHNRMTWAAGFGLVMTFAALFMALGPRADLSVAVVSFPFWMKFAYTVSLSALAVRMLTQLSQPGAAVANGGWLLMPVLALSSVALCEMARISAGGWRQLWLGHSALQCPIRIAMLSIPLFIAFSIAVRTMAPTRPRVAGALVGITSAAMAATVYGLACDEVSATFVLTWYSLGIAVSTSVGAVLGAWILRW